MTRFHVCGDAFCFNNSKRIGCYERGSALVPAITVLNQRLYKRNRIPIPLRPRKGFYIPYE